MTNDLDNRVLSRKGARVLSDEETRVVSAAGTLKVTRLPNGEIVIIADS